MSIIESNNGKEAVDWFLRKMTSLKIILLMSWNHISVDKKKRKQQE